MKFLFVIFSLFSFFNLFSIDEYEEFLLRKLQFIQKESQTLDMPCTNFYFLAGQAIATQECMFEYSKFKMESDPD